MTDIRRDAVLRMIVYFIPIFVPLAPTTCLSPLSGDIGSGSKLSSSSSLFVTASSLLSCCYIPLLVVPACDLSIQLPLVRWTVVVSSAIYPIYLGRSLAMLCIQLLYCDSEPDISDLVLSDSVYIPRVVADRSHLQV